MSVAFFQQTSAPIEKSEFGSYLIVLIIETHPLMYHLVLFIFYFFDKFEK